MNKGVSFEIYNDNMHSDQCKKYNVIAIRG
jgi:hypothetical protein